MFEQRRFFHPVLSQGFRCEVVLFVSPRRKMFFEGMDTDVREITYVGRGYQGWI